MPRFIIIIPVFNHARTIARVIADARAIAGRLPEGAPVLVLDDGCTDATPAILSATREITVLTHSKNRGKGAALLTAFEYGRQHGFTHAITLDADGQHNVSDVPRLAAAARQHPDDLIIGWRDMEHPSAVPTDDARPTNEIPYIPAASKKGRDISRFWLRIQTGQDIPDSQCGLRAYPLANLRAPPYRFHRFDFETEILARAAWGGIKIRSIPVACIYFPKSIRVSHFRPVLDTLRGIRVNVFLVARRLLPLPFPQLVPTVPALHKFGHWWKPAAWKIAFHRALQAGNTNSELASAFALGIFVGLTPLYFLQTLLAIYFARRLHLNILAAVIGSQISIPPLAPLWFILSYGAGNLLLHGQWISADWNAFSSRMVPAFLLGSLVVATFVSAAGLFLARQILPRIRPNPIPSC